MTDIITVVNPSHIKQNGPELRKTSFRKGGNPKNFGAWIDEDAFKDEPTEIINICFMAISKTSDIRTFECQNFPIIQNSLDMIIDELQSN